MNNCFNNLLDIFEDVTVKFLTGYMADGCSLEYKSYLEIVTLWCTYTHTHTNKCRESSLECNKDNEHIYTILEDLVSQSKFF